MTKQVIYKDLNEKNDHGGILLESGDVIGGAGALLASAEKGAEWELVKELDSWTNLDETIKGQAEAVSSEIDVPAYYIEDFLSTKLGSENADELNRIIGAIACNEKETKGANYVFSGSLGSGKTSIMTMIRLMFKDRDDVVYSFDGAFHNTDYSSEKTHFIETHFELYQIMNMPRRIPNLKVFEMTEERYHTKAFQHVKDVIEHYSDHYRDYCQKLYLEWKKSQS